MNVSYRPKADITKALLGNGPSESQLLLHQVGVLQIGDEHVPGDVGDHEGKLGVERDGLRRHAASPEERKLAG